MCRRKQAHTVRLANEWIVELELEGKPRSKGKRWMMKGGGLVDSKGRGTNSCGVVFRFAKMKSRASSELRRRRNTNSGLLLAYRVVPGHCCSATVGSSIQYGSCMGTQGIVCTCSYLGERGADCSGCSCPSPPTSSATVSNAPTSTHAPTLNGIEQVSTYAEQSDAIESAEDGRD